MQFLKYLENNFDSLSYKVKVELFIFPLVLIFIFFYIFILNREVNEKVNLDTSSNYFVKVRTKNMKTKIVSILKDIEHFANKNHIKLLSVSNDNKTIEISIKADMLEQIEFIKYIEDYNSFSRINTIELNSNELIVKIDFDNFFIKNKLDLKEKIIALKSENKIVLHLQAIVEKSVLINDKWFKINEAINSYKITKIQSNKVYLTNGFKIIKLKLYHDNF